MSHPLQADNYSVSDGVRWRVGWGTSERERGVGGTMIHHHRVLNTHPSSATCPLQPPASSLAACLRVTRWHWLFFFMCCNSTPFQSNCEEHLCFSTTRQPLTGRKKGWNRASVGHKSFTGWQLLPNVDCFLVIFKPLVLLSLLVATYVGCRAETSKYKTATLRSKKKKTTKPAGVIYCPLCLKSAIKSRLGCQNRFIK